MTVTGTFKDSQGNALSGVEITFELDNYGSDMPRLSGTNVMLPLRFTGTTDANGQISVILAGNDTITPTGTQYVVTISGLYEFDIQRSYVFSGSSEDISQLTPEDAVPAATPPIASVTVALAPSATGNFTVAHALGRTPVGVMFFMTSGILVWFQSPKFDASNLYLVASDAGSGEALIW